MPTSYLFPLLYKDLSIQSPPKVNLPLLFTTIKVISAGFYGTLTATAGQKIPEWSTPGNYGSFWLTRGRLEIDGALLEMGQKIAESHPEPEAGDITVVYGVSSIGLFQKVTWK